MEVIKECLGIRVGRQDLFWAKTKWPSHSSGRGVLHVCMGVQMCSLVHAAASAAVGASAHQVQVCVGRC